MKKYFLYIIILTSALQSTSRAQVPALNSYSPAAATVYLVFDGAEIEGTVWNEHGKIVAEASGLSPASVTWIHKIIADHFKLFNLNITTDPEVYKRAPAHQRVRVIITPDGSWWGPATGVAAIGSFVWGDDTPAFVFMNALTDNPSYIAAAATHQIGHTLGLQHQSVYDSYGAMITELSGGESNIFSNQAPLMGIPFYKEAVWKDGHPSTGARNMQSDTAAIAGAPNWIGYRKNNDEFMSPDNAIKIERQGAGFISLISTGDYAFSLINIDGRLLTQGMLKPGFNEIRTSMASTGVMVLKWSGEYGSGSQKIMN